MGTLNKKWGYLDYAGCNKRNEQYMVMQRVLEETQEQEVEDWVRERTFRGNILCFAVISSSRIPKQLQGDEPHSLQDSENKPVRK